MDLIEQVEIALQTECSSGLPQVRGFTSPKIRSFLNQLLKFPEFEIYLEVGTFCGATLTAAAFNNHGTFIGVDNFSEFGGSYEEAVTNLQQTSAGLLKGDWSDEFFRRSLRLLLENKVDVFFYDGAHGEIDHYQAIKWSSLFLKDSAIVIVDDWNWTSVKEGTRRGFLDSDLVIKKSWSFSTEFNGDAESWWNGIFIAVVNKI